MTVVRLGVYPNCTHGFQAPPGSGHESPRRGAPRRFASSRLPLPPRPGARALLVTLSVLPSNMDPESSDILGGRLPVVRHEYDQSWSLAGKLYFTLGAGLVLWLCWLRVGPYWRQYREKQYRKYVPYPVSHHWTRSHMTL